MPHPIVRFALAVAVALAASAPRARGGQQASPAAPDPTPTFTVSVTEAAELIENVGTTRRLDAAEIRAMHARTLDEALRMLPGVYVRTGGDGTPRIDVRGFRSRHVLLLVDGVPVNSTSDGQFDPRQIPTESIREIKVSYGSSSMLYGDNAMAGVIEVVTDSPRPGVHGTLGVDVGKAAEGNGAGRLSLAGGRASLVASGSAFSTPGFGLSEAFQPTRAEDGGVRNNSDVARRSGLAKLGVAVTDTLQLGALVTFSAGSFGVPPATVSDPADIFAQAVRYERVENYRNLTAQASFAWRPVPSFNLRGWTYVNDQDENRARYDSATYASIDEAAISGTFRARNQTRIAGGQVLGRVDLGRGGWLRVATNGRGELFETSGVIRDVAIGGSGGGGGGGGGGRGSTTTPTRYALRSFSDVHRVDVYSTGAEWELRPAARTGAVLGFSRHWQQREASSGDAASSWLAGATFDVTPAVQLHASGTHKIRFPSIQQLYDAAAGSAALQAERADEIEAGMAATLGGRGQLGVAVFSTRVSNFIERDAGARYRNRDRYAFSGAELTFDSRAVRRLDLRTSYGYLDSQDLSGTTGGSDLQYRPRHRAAIDTRWTLPARWSARAAWSYVAGQVYYSRTTPAVQARAGNYALVDASFTRAVWSGYDVTVSVDNLFDRSYEQAYGQPRPGRTLLLSLRGRF